MSLRRSPDKVIRQTERKMGYEQNQNNMRCGIKRLVQLAGHPGKSAGHRDRHTTLPDAAGQDDQGTSGRQNEGRITCDVATNGLRHLQRYDKIENREQPCTGSVSLSSRKKGGGVYEYIRGNIIDVDIRSTYSYAYLLYQ